MRNGKASVILKTAYFEHFCVDYLEQLDDSEESEDEDILGEIEHLKISGQWFEKEV